MMGPSPNLEFGIDTVFVETQIVLFIQLNQNDLLEYLQTTNHLSNFSH